MLRKNQKDDGISEQVLLAEYESVYRYALSICHGEAEAEDITQDTFLRAIKSKDGFEGNCSLYTWLCTIAKNLWINRCKKLGKEASSDELVMDIPEQKASIEQMIVQKENLSSKIKKVACITLILIKKNTIFSIEDGRNTDTYELVLPDDCEDLYFNNELIWSKDNNHDDNIPEYVYAQDYYLRQELGYDRGFSMSIHGDVIFFKAWKEDGKKIVWDTDGNVVYEEYPDKDGIYPE